MSNPTEKPKETRIDEWMWQLLVQACGSRCCTGDPECEWKPSEPLHRGHVFSRAECRRQGIPLDIHDSYDNLVPTCEPCNKKFGKGLTPTSNRPDNWNELFARLLLGKMRPKICLQVIDGKAQIIYSHPELNNTENKWFIDWDSSDSTLATEVFTSSENITNEEARGIVEGFIIACRRLRGDGSPRFAARPSYPDDKEWQPLIVLARKVRKERFVNAGWLFLNDQDLWVRPAGPREYIAREQMWMKFVRNFDLIEREEADRITRKRRQEWEGWAQSRFAESIEQVANVRKNHAVLNDDDREFRQQCYERTQRKDDWKKGVSDSDYARCKELLKRVTGFDEAERRKNYDHPGHELAVAKEKWRRVVNFDHAVNKYFNVLRKHNALDRIDQCTTIADVARIGQAILDDAQRKMTPAERAEQSKLNSQVAEVFGSASHLTGIAGGSDNGFADDAESNREKTRKHKGAARRTRRA